MVDSSDKNKNFATQLELQAFGQEVLPTATPEQIVRDLIQELQIPSSRVAEFNTGVLLMLQGGMKPTDVIRVSRTFFNIAQKTQVTTEKQPETVELVEHPDLNQTKSSTEIMKPSVTSKKELTPTAAEQFLRANFRQWRDLIKLADFLENYISRMKLRINETEKQVVFSNLTEVTFKDEMEARRGEAQEFLMLNDQFSKILFQFLQELVQNILNPIVRKRKIQDNSNGLSDLIRYLTQDALSLTSETLILSSAAIQDFFQAFQQVPDLFSDLEQFLENYPGHNNKNEFEGKALAMESQIVRRDTIAPAEVQIRSYVPEAVTGGEIQGRVLELSVNSETEQARRVFYKVSNEPARLWRIYKASEIGKESIREIVAALQANDEERVKVLLAKIGFSENSFTPTLLDDFKKADPTEIAAQWDGIDTKDVAQALFETLNHLEDKRLYQELRSFVDRLSKISYRTKPIEVFVNILQTSLDRQPIFRGQILNIVKQILLFTDSDLSTILQHFSPVLSQEIIAQALLQYHLKQINLLTNEELAKDPDLALPRNSEELAKYAQFVKRVTKQNQEELHRKEAISNGQNLAKTFFVIGEAAPSNKQEAEMAHLPEVHVYQELSPETLEDYFGEKNSDLRGKVLNELKDSSDPRQQEMAKKIEEKKIELRKVAAYCHLSCLLGVIPDQRFRSLNKPSGLLFSDNFGFAKDGRVIEFDFGLPFFDLGLNAEQLRQARLIVMNLLQNQSLFTTGEQKSQFNTEYRDFLKRSVIQQVKQGKIPHYFMDREKKDKQRLEDAIDNSRDAIIDQIAERAISFLEREIVIGDTAVTQKLLGLTDEEARQDLLNYLNR